MENRPFSPEPSKPPENFSSELEKSEEIWRMLNSENPPGFLMRRGSIMPITQRDRQVESFWRAVRQVKFEQILGPNYFDFQRLVTDYPESNILLVAPKEKSVKGVNHAIAFVASEFVPGLSDFGESHQYKLAKRFVIRYDFSPTLAQPSIEQFDHHLIYLINDERDFRRHLDIHLRQGNLEALGDSFMSKLPPNYFSENQEKPFMVAIQGTKLDFPFPQFNDPHKRIDHYWYGYRFYGLICQRFDDPKSTQLLARLDEVVMLHQGKDLTPVHQESIATLIKMPIIRYE